MKKNKKESVALCIGHAAYDMTVVLDEYPVENTKYRVNKRVECGGGPASTAAYLLGKWGVKTYFAGVVGSDIYGKRIKHEFEEVGVDTTFLEISKEYDTTSSFIIVNKKNGSRTTFAYRKDKMGLMTKDIDLKADFILVDGQELELSIKELKDSKNAISVLDAGRNTESNMILAKMVDYLVTSRNFAEEFASEKINLDDRESVIRVFEKLEKRFKNNVVITLEDNGSLYRYNGEIKLMPAYKVKAKDTTGAGDIYHGAFLYGLIRGFNYEDVVKIATIAGGLSVRKIGGRFSVPSLEEVMEIYEETK